MIEFKSLHLENFMNIESLDLDFDNDSIVIIQGDNGSGKSAMMNAIAFALTGYRKGDTYKDYIRSGYSSAKVVLDIVYKGFPMHIDAEILENKGTSSVNKVILYKGTTYTNSECGPLLESLDAEYLEYVMFLFQQDNSIVDLKPAERAKLLKKLFHFEFEPQVEAIKTRIESATQHYTELSVRLEELKKRTFTLLPLVPIAIDIEQTTKEIARLDETIAKSATFDEQKMRETQLLLQQEKDTYQRYVSLKNSYVSEIASKELILKGLQNLKEPEPVELISDSLLGIVNLEKATLTELISKQNSLKRDISVLQSQLSVSRTGICHACGNKIDAEHVQKLEQELQHIETTLAEVQSQVEAQNQLVQTKEIEYQKQLSNERAYTSALTQYQTSLQTKQSIEQILLEKKTALTEIEKSLAQSEAKVQELTVENDRNIQSFESLKDLVVMKKTRDDLQRSLDEAKRALIINEERLAQNARVEQEKQEHEIVMQGVQTQIDTVSTELATLKKALEIFEKTFPNFVIIKACSEIELLLNDIIQRVFPYMKVKLSQSRSGIDFFYTVSDLEDRWLPAKMASGAQTAILSLAWRVAIAKLYGISSIMLDEIDAQATDENAKFIYDFIASLSFFKQIILISHRREALRAISSLVDNVTSYEVREGEYTQINASDFF